MAQHGCSRSHRTDKTKPAAHNIVLLMSGGPLAEIIVNGLTERVGPITVIREAPEAKGAVIKRRARLLGWPVALGQLAFGVVQRLFVKGDGRCREIWRHYGLNPTPNRDIVVHDVPSVNSPACHALLSEINPDVVAVYGTRILKASTLVAVDAPFVNYHAGINPKYRGQHPGYWALASNDPDHAGVTVHLVDRGVDTGHVLYQTRVAFTDADSIATYQHVQAAYALPLFSRALQDAIAGRLNPKQVDLPSKQWFPPTLWAYLFNGVMRGVGSGWRCQVFEPQL